jgi:hypothetical protein
MVRARQAVQPFLNQPVRGDRVEAQAQAVLRELQD